MRRPGPTHRRNPLSLVVTMLVVLLLLQGSATAAAVKPDAHDRALAARLDAQAATFRVVAARTKSLKTAPLDGCPYLKKHPNQAFAAVFVLLPALMVDLVNRFKPQLTDLRDTIATMRPHSPLFRQWLSAETKSFDLILQFDSHGRRVNLCTAMSVMLDEASSAAAIRRALGVDPSLVAKLFSSGSAVSSTLTRLNPRMRAFFIAAGVPHRNAVALTS